MSRTEDFGGTWTFNKCPNCGFECQLSPRERRSLLKAVQEAHDELINLQPHIPQACIPGHEPFIDSHVDKAIEILASLQDPK